MKETIKNIEQELRLTEELKDLIREKDVKISILEENIQAISNERQLNGLKKQVRLLNQF